MYGRRRRRGVFWWRRAILTCRLAVGGASHRMIGAQMPVGTGFIGDVAQRRIEPGILDRLGHNRGSRALGHVADEPVPTGICAPIIRWLAPPTARRQVRRSPSATQSEPPSAPSVAIAVRKTSGNSASKSSEELNLFEICWMRRRRSTSPRSESADCCARLPPSGAVEKVSTGNRRPGLEGDA